MDIKKALVELGLSKNASNVYLALLSTGLSQAGPIVKVTKLHRVLVYGALEELQELGLVTVQRKKNIQLFKPADLSVLESRAQRVESLVQSIIPELRKLQSGVGDTVDVRTLVGQEGFRQNLEDVVLSASKQKDKTMRIIGGAKDTDFYKAVGGWYDEYTELLEQKGVKKMLLAPASYSSEFKQKFVEEWGTQLRTLPKGLTSPIYTRITDELVAIEIYEPQLVVIQIRNRAVAQGYKDSFELLWKE